MKEHTETYINLEQQIPAGAEEILKNGDVYIAHNAWDHSMSRISPLFEIARFTDAIVYQRPLA
jgi:hypothetical protein